MTTLPQRATVRRAPPARIDQSEVIAWLATPAAYGLQPGSVERIDTHTSVVFLAGDSVFKLKRAVRFDYLDYWVETSGQTCHMPQGDQRGPDRLLAEAIRHVAALCADGDNPVEGAWRSMARSLFMRLVAGTEEVSADDATDDSTSNGFLGGCGTRA